MCFCNNSRLDSLLKKNFWVEGIISINVWKSFLFGKCLRIPRYYFWLFMRDMTGAEYIPPPICGLSPEVYCDYNVQMSDIPCVWERFIVKSGQCEIRGDCITSPNQRKPPYFFTACNISGIDLFWINDLKIKSLGVTSIVHDYDKK